MWILFKNIDKRGFHNNRGNILDIREPVEHWLRLIVNEMDFQDVKSDPKENCKYLHTHNTEVVIYKLIVSRNLTMEKNRLK